MMRNRKRAGSILSHCLNLTLKSMEVSIFIIIGLTTLFSYILMIVEQKRFGAPYLARMAIRSFWLDVSKYFTMSSNATQLGKLWLCCRCSKLFKVNIPYGHLTPWVEPHIYLTPCTFMTLNARQDRMLLNIFALMSIRVTPRHFLWSNKYPLFATGSIWPLWHS